MKSLLIHLFVLLILPAWAQNETYISGIEKYQKELNEEFKDPKESPLEPRGRRRFNELGFFPINEKYRVTARVVLSQEKKPFNMPTTIPRENIHWKYADLVFELDGKEYSLEVYQSENLMNTEEYADYLFLPFLDETNGEESYGGGRYIDLRIPEGDTMEIDFNKAYNPYCAYSARYSCPIVPRVNRLMIPIPAGVKAWKDGH